MAVSVSLVPCNDIGLLTNKGKKPDVLKIDSNRIAISYDDIGIVVLKPIIDRIIFGFFITQDFINQYDTTISAQEYKDYIKGSLFHEAKYADGVPAPPIDGVSFVKNVSFKKGPFSHYKVNIKYSPPSGSDSVMIQIGPKEESAKRPFMRFDMKPYRFSQKAMAEFRKFIEELMGMPGGSVQFKDIIANSIIYRAEVAVDILGTRPYDLEIRPLSNKKYSPHKSHTYQSATGRLETVYPKAKAGKSSSEYIYDKRKELLETGKIPDFGDLLHSRFECRVEKTTFHKLPNIKNRCGRVSVRAVDYHKFSQLELAESLFIRLALNRNLDKALEMVPVESQVYFQQIYEDVVHDIWDAGKLWSYWKDAVMQCGLCDV